MSGLEVLGAIASATQLVNYCLSISTNLQEVCQLASGQPNRYESQLNEIDQLIRTIQIIEKSKPLQTQEIRQQLDSMGRVAQELHEFLCQTIRDSQRKSGKLIWKAIFSGNWEARIKKAVDVLAEQKATLTLTLLGTYCSMLLEIRDSVSSRISHEELDSLSFIRDRVVEIDKKLESYPGLFKEIAQAQEQPPSVTKTGVALQSIIAGCSPIASGGNPADGLGNQDRSAAEETEIVSQSDLAVALSNTLTLLASAQSSAPRTAEPQCISEIPRMPSPPPYAVETTEVPQPDDMVFQYSPDRPSNHRSYNRVWAASTARQVNASIGAITSGLSSSHYTNIAALGNSRQINGDIADSSFVLSFLTN